jgi:TRAP-type C4-dicarboxylate transport system substrate-binding protein
VSGGRIKVEVETNFGGGTPGAESDLVKALAAGEVDAGWPSTRAFERAGLPGLAVVEAPLTLTSYAGQKALATSATAKTLLARLDGTGVVGLGLAVGPLRRPFAAEGPLLGPEDWAGVTFRAFNSPQQEAAIRALGATALNVGEGWVDEVREGRLRGAEFDIAQYAHNNLTSLAGNVTANVVLWPKMFVLAIGAERFNALTAEQQGWVRTAADRAVRASAEATYDESGVARTLCAKGVRFRDATAAQIDGLRAKLRPSLAKLDDDPVLLEIQEIATRHPEPEPIDVPAACREGVSARDPGAIPTAVAQVPDGTYRAELTAADVAAAGFDNSSGSSGTWTLRISRGTYELSCKPIANPGTDCGHAQYDGPLDMGDLRGTGRTVHFVYDAERLAERTGCGLPVSTSIAGRCPAGDPFRLDWRIDGDRLVFSDPVDTVGCEMFVEPWRRIA